MPEEITRKFLYREYKNSEETHSPYINMLHTLEDKEEFQLSNFEEEFQKIGVQDGEVIKITIRRTREKPFPNRIWKLTAPHTYSPVEKEKTEN